VVAVAADRTIRKGSSSQDSNAKMDREAHAMARRVRRRIQAAVHSSPCSPMVITKQRDRSKDNRSTAIRE